MCMTTPFTDESYGCTYYYINEDSYIYMRSLIMKDKEKNDFLSSLGFSFPLFILYNKFTYFIFLFKKEKSKTKRTVNFIQF